MVRSGFFLIKFGYVLFDKFVFCFIYGIMIVYIWSLSKVLMSRFKRVIWFDGWMFNSVFDVVKEIEKYREMLVSFNVISRCCCGLCESVYGYRWKFLDY